MNWRIVIGPTGRNRNLKAAELTDCGVRECVRQVYPYEMYARADIK